ncbi:MAG TPA: hypothetical protein VNO33_10970 [Kofleriaceae bacterium]|nr:hypothetical protein [Kofleriaceae bacterium]
MRGGYLHQTLLAAPVGPNADHAMLLGAIESDLVGKVGALEPDRFAVRRDFTTASPAGGNLRHVDLMQNIDGVPVHGTYLQITVREEAGSAKVVGSSFRLYKNPQVDTTVTVERGRAIALARDSQRLVASTPLLAQELQVREMRGVLELVWATALRGTHNRSLVIASGPRAGRVVNVDERVFETTGNVSGVFVTAGSPSGLGVVTTDGLANLDVTAPSGSTQTDADGNYLLDVPATETIEARLNGRAATTITLAGTPLVASGLAGPTLDLFLGSAPGNEIDLAQVTAYVFADATRSFVEANGVPSEDLGEPLTTNTNLPDICNAFYSPFERSINFFQSGGGCNNSATDSIAAHEYGHFVDDMEGGIIDGGLSEGWGDLLSCYMLGVPEVGFDLFPGEALRNCENDYVFPPDGNDEVHNLGQAWAGFAWLVRQGLIAKHGEEVGEPLARALVLASLPSNAADILAGVREVFLRDDDDGDLSNETPNWDVLYPAALHHGLTIAIETDLIAPAAVTDLTATSVGATSVTLSWTAPGDDENEGTASTYEVRFSTEPITPENFETATVAPGAPAPSPAGTPETMVVTAPPATSLFFAMVTRDEQFNTSPLSNVIEATTAEGTVIYQEGAEDGLGEYTATGLWHVTATQASEGTQSFWYGQEATGNYDTPGAANSGVLTSPIIDLSAAADPILVLSQLIETEEGNTFDVFTITVTDADDPTNTASFEKETGSTGGVFAFRLMPLTQFAGRRVQLSFSFDTVDDLFNDFAGWFIDDIRIIVSASECEHDVCEAGGPLQSGCSTCATTVCDADPFCCEVFWDRICVQEAEELCGETCTGCAHDLCAQGEALEATCDPCAQTVCDADPFCCENAWDARCVTEADQLCGLACAECTHDLCEAGGPLSSTCDPCVAAVCESDAYCCGTAWDDRCVEAATETCGLTCDGGARR